MSEIERKPITAWATRERGAGWSNQPIWVLFRDLQGKLSVECIQPEKQSDEMRILHRISAEVSEAMLNAVIREREW